VGFFARDVRIEAPMPSPAEATTGARRGRQHLDTLLLEEAARAGAEVRQPARGTRGCRRARADRCARILGARHLPADIIAPRPSDLLGFKARFAGARLPAG
jgi:hypothetical protein